MDTLTTASPEIQPKDNHQKMVIIAVCLVVLFGIIVLCVVLTLPRTEAHAATGTYQNDYGQESDVDMSRYDALSQTSLPGGHQIYSRADWGSLPPKFTRSLNHPAPFVVISDTITTPCYSFRRCSLLVKSIQNYHMEISLSDIGYNFLVGGDGNVYEGRGWDVTNMHTGFVSRCNVAINFIGTFVHDRPPEKQLNAALELVNLGVRLGKISPNYKLLGMNQTTFVTSPGPVLYSIIKKWPHHWLATEDDIGRCPYHVE